MCRLQTAAKSRAAASFWSVQGAGDAVAKSSEGGAEEVEGFEEVKSKKKGRKIRSEDGSFAFEGATDAVSKSSDQGTVPAYRTYFI